MSSTVGSRVGHRTRMSPDDRREQLLEIGVRLLSTRPLDELSIELLAEEAGISRGLLYHYFANKQEFHVAVVRHAAEDIYAITAPRNIDDPIEQLKASVAAYVDYVAENHVGYTSLVRAAKGGNDELREIYEAGRTALTDRVFEAVGLASLTDMGLADTPLNRRVVRGWAAFVEDLVLSWVEDPADLTRDRLLEVLADALPGLLGAGDSPA